MGESTNTIDFSAPKEEQFLPQGLGTRHEAAAAVTLTTEALALCVSQSTGTVTIFRRGKLLTDIQKPRGRTNDGLSRST